MTHLSLIGMMGSGKTTVAKIISEYSDLQFVDLDTEVETKAEMEIPDIFSKYGEAKFRELESHALEEVMSNPMPSVVATGGGIVLKETNRKLLKEKSVVVWLSVSPEELDRRINNSNFTDAETMQEQKRQEQKRHRPLLEDGRTTLEVLTHLHTERVKLYKKSSSLALGGEMMGAPKLAEKSLEHYQLQAVK